MRSISVEVGKTAPAAELDVLYPPTAAAARIETPYAIYDCDVVRARLAQLAEHLPGVDVHYAVKCNPSTEILATVLEQGASFEVASIYELDQVRALGANPANVLFSNPVKPTAHIAAAARQGVRCFAVDSECEVRKVAEAAPGRRVYVRLAVADHGSRFPLSKKFGTSVEEAERLMLLATELGLDAYGVTFHVGSQCTDPAAWSAALARCADLMLRLDRSGLRLAMVDLGGGLPVPYDDGVRVPELAEIAAEVRRGLAALPYRPSHLVIEPGRFVVATAGVLVASVIGLTEREGQRWVHVDVGGYNALMEAVQTEGRWLFPLWTTATTSEADPTATCVITGPSCDSSDTLFYDVELPVALEVDDRIVIGCAGAYTVSYASSFNGFAPPANHFHRAPTLVLDTMSDAGASNAVGPSTVEMAPAGRS